MIEKAQNKMITSSKNKAQQSMNARDSFIVEKHTKGFNPTEILTLLDREGFKKPARSRIYQILEKHGSIKK